MVKRMIIPVVLCGGSGSRLWPLSRSSFPKQFLTLIENKENTFLQDTIKRLSGLKNLLQPLIICNQEHRFIVAEQLREIGIKPSSILLEPFGRNTAPAIAIAALKAIEHGQDPHLLVLSSDHLIKDEDSFRKVIQSAILYSEKDKLVTFGIPPHYPETGYGYIEAKGINKNNKPLGLEIKKFIEKPNLEKAKMYLMEKKYLWNSGIFLFKASKILKEIKDYSPKVIECCRKSLTYGNRDLEFIRLDEDSFKKCPNISIDVAVMEKTNFGIVMPMKVGWNDLGNWDALYKESKKDIKGNSISGKVYLDNVKDSFVKAESRLIVGLGIKDLIIIETNDAVLVMKKKYSQNLKEVVKKLDQEKIPEANIHKKVFRPWGNYISIENGSRWQVKRIEVNPKSSLSLQMHKHRAEHWVVVTGRANVVIDEKEIILLENQSTYIPLGSKHRLENKTDNPLVIIEVQSGDYFGEDDIIRFKDSYGRK